MSNYERNPGTVTVWQTSKKEMEENQKRPVMTGEFKTPNGELFKLSLWWATEKDSNEKKKDKNQNQYLTGTVQVPQQGNGSGLSNAFGNASEIKTEDNGWGQIN